VFGKHEVPSFAFKKDKPGAPPHYEGAYETRYMVALFAGNGMALMAADYFGMGGDAQGPEAYFVQGSTQRANYDLYLDVQKFLKEQGISPARLFLGGWSLGGLNTTGFLHKLESEGVNVHAAFTASAPSDPYAALHGLMYSPREELDAVWLNTIVALSVFSYENYYNKPGLARSVIRPSYYADMESVYTRSYGSPANLLAMFHKLGRKPLLEYFRPEFADSTVFSKSAYAELLRQNDTYRHGFKSPLRMYYGSRDEAIKESIGTLASNYQDILFGNPGDKHQKTLQTKRVPGANHRATFITAAPDALIWMLSKP
jgi:hypothetical protein